MDELALSVRYARPSDAADLARVYIESWQDTYAGLLAHSLLAAMSLKSHTARWRATLRGPGAVLVAEDAGYGPIGLASLGTARDRALGRRATLSSYRALRLSPRRAGALRLATALATGEARTAGTASRAGSRHAHRRRDRGDGAARRRHAGRP